MTKEDVSMYTRRITQGNKTDIIVVLFDVYADYCRSAKESLKAGDENSLKESLHYCNEVIVHLENDLNFAYEISTDLYKLYNYVQRSLARFTYKRDARILDDTLKIMNSLREAFAEVAEQDTSGRQMVNAETVVAGMTYGRGTLYEMTDYDLKRGFYA